MHGLLTLTERGSNDSKCNPFNCITYCLTNLLLYICNRHLWTINFTMIFCVYVFIILGSIFVGMKDLLFEPLSPMRQARELYNVLKQCSFTEPVLFPHTNEGLDDRLTLSLSNFLCYASFLRLVVDYLCAGRTAPYHRWHNPVERIMLILNLGLQCVGLVRSRISFELEAEVEKCNNLTVFSFLSFSSFKCDNPSSNLTIYKTIIIQLFFH